MGSAAATVVLTEEQLRTLMSTVEDFPADSLGLAAPDVTMSTELSVFGVSHPRERLAHASAPSTGDLVLTPASLQLAGAEITADGSLGPVRPARRRRAARLDRLHRASTSPPASR